MDELIKHYAAEIKQINVAGTEGDYTWEGLLASFVAEAVAKGVLFTSRSY